MWTEQEGYLGRLTPDLAHSFLLEGKPKVLVVREAKEGACLGQDG